MCTSDPCVHVIFFCVYKWSPCHSNQPIKQPIKQSPSQATNHPISYQATKHAINQSTNESSNQSAIQPIKRPSRPSKQSTNPSIHQPIKWRKLARHDSEELYSIDCRTYIKDRCCPRLEPACLLTLVYTCSMNKAPHWCRVKDIDADLIAWNPPTITRQFMWISVDCLKDHWITEACGWIVEHSLEPVKRIWPCQQEQESLRHARSGTVGVLACFGFLFQERKPGTPFF